MYTSLVLISTNWFYVYFAGLPNTNIYTYIFYYLLQLFLGILTVLIISITDSLMFISCVQIGLQIDCLIDELKSNKKSVNRTLNYVHRSHVKLLEYGSPYN